MQGSNPAMGPKLLEKLKDYVLDNRYQNPVTGLILLPTPTGLVTSFKSVDQPRKN